MKKLSAIVLSCVIVMIAMTALMISPAALVEGDWVTSRSANDYEDESSYCPAPGYHYDAELGFVMDPPEYARDNTPFVQAHTKKPLDLKADNDGKGNSVSLKFTVLEYAYDGGEAKDQWIALTLNSQPISTPGSVDYGEGLCILIRGGGFGSAQVQPFYVDKETGKSFSAATAFPQVEVPMNDQDQEEYTFTVKYVDGGYVYAVNGHEFVADATLNAHFDRVFADGAYVSLICQTGVADTRISLAINEWQGKLPYGEDSAAPEEDLRELAIIADPSTVPQNQPAVLWDSTLRDFRKFNIVGADYEINGDGSIHITTQALSTYISFAVKSNVSYEASDFPYVAVLTRNCWAKDSAQVYYCAGPILTPSGDYSENWKIDGVNYADGWSLGLMDFSEYNEDGWCGRINSIRIDFSFYPEDLLDAEYNNFDIGFIGAFRSPEEAYAYTEQYLAERGYDSIPDIPETTAEPDTEYVTDNDSYYETSYETYYETVTTPGFNFEEFVTNVFEEHQSEIDKGHFGIENSILGNGLVGELLASDLLSSCTSVTAVPILTVLTAFGFALVFKKKD